MSLIASYLSLLIAWALLGFYIAPAGFSTNFLFVNASLALVAYLLSMGYAAKTFSRFSWIGIFSLFNLSFVIIHFMYSFLVRFYSEIAGNMFVWMSPDAVCRASCASLAGFAGFLLGYLNYRARKGVVPIDQPVPTCNLSVLTYLPYVLTGASVALLLVVMMIDPSFYLSGYYGLTDAASAQRGLFHFFILYKVFYFGGVIVDFYRLRLQYDHLNPLQFVLRANKVVLLNVVMLMGLSFYVGDRGPILQTVCLYGGACSVFFFRLRLVVVVLALVSGMVMMGIMRDFRTSERGVSLSERMEEGSYKFEERAWYDVPGELGSNVRVLHVAVGLTEGGNYFWGLFKLNNAVAVVPFASRLVSGLMGPYLSGLTSSAYMTAVIIGPYSQIGVGTTIITDIYLDFGLWGCPILMALLGMFFGWLENRCFSSLSFYAHGLCMMCMAYAFYWPRSSYVTSGKEIFWTLFLLIIIHRTIGSRFKLSTRQILSSTRQSVLP